MKKANRPSPRPSDGLKAEYEFDYAKAKNNRFGSPLKGRTVVVVLEPDVAAAFPDSTGVNTQLRSALSAVPRRSRRGRRTSRRRPTTR